MLARIAFAFCLTALLSTRPPPRSRSASWFPPPARRPPSASRRRTPATCLPKKIGDATVEYIQLEDGGDTTRAVQNIKKLIQENNIDALIGPSTTPNALRDPRRHRRGQGADDGDRGHVGGRRAARREEALGVQDDAERRPHRRRADEAHGEERREDDRLHRLQRSRTARTGTRCSAALAEKAGISIVANERYARTDQSVTGQTLKLIAAKPDAVLIAAVGGPAVLPQATLFDQGYKGRDLPDARGGDRRLHQARQGEGRRHRPRRGPDAGDRRDPRLEPDEESGAAATSPPMRSSSAASPRRSAPTRGTAACCSSARSRSALKAGKPGTEAFRVALRDALEKEREVVGTQGVFNMSADQPQRHGRARARAGRRCATASSGCCRSDRHRTGAQPDRPAHRRHPARGREGRALRRRQAARAAARARRTASARERRSASPPAMHLMAALPMSSRSCVRGDSMLARAAASPTGARVVECERADEGMGASLACGVAACAGRRRLDRRACGHAVDRADDDRAVADAIARRRRDRRHRSSTASAAIRLASRVAHGVAAGGTRPATKARAAILAAHKASIGMLAVADRRSWSATSTVATTRASQSALTAAGARLAASTRPAEPLRVGHRALAHAATCPAPGCATWRSGAPASIAWDYMCAPSTETTCRAATPTTSPGGCAGPARTWHSTIRRTP